MAKIKITKGVGWYYDKVGQEFEYVKEVNVYNSHIFWIDKPKEMGARYVLAEDCVKVNDICCRTCHYHFYEGCNNELVSPMTSCICNDYPYYKKKEDKSCSICKWSYGIICTNSQIVDNHGLHCANDNYKYFEPKEEKKKEEKSCSTCDWYYCDVCSCDNDSVNWIPNCTDHGYKFWKSKEEKGEDKSCSTCYYDVNDDCTNEAVFCDSCVSNDYKFWRAKPKEEEKKMEHKCNKCKWLHTESMTCDKLLSELEKENDCFEPKEESKYITKDRYEGLDPDIADLLKQGKMVLGNFVNSESVTPTCTYLLDYCSGSDYPYINIFRKGAKFFEPILKETEEEVDWSKVPVDTKILVKDNICDWKKRYFAEYKNASVYTWNDGATSFSAEGAKRNWQFAKLYKEGEEKC